jgi:hypothetical protein
MVLPHAPAMGAGLLHAEKALAHLHHALAAGRYPQVFTAGARFGAGAAASLAVLHSWECEFGILCQTRLPLA